MSKELMPTFLSFLKDKEAPNMYITGVAGTGKTTKLNELLAYCLTNKIPAVAVAYTHKACTVLKTKLPKDANIATLHSFLKKRPTVNGSATKLAHVDGNAVVGTSDVVDLLFIDEYSMVGEKDYVDIVDKQYDEDGNLLMKVIYIGDPNQLPPVKDMKAINPSGSYWVKLSKIYRQANDNPLMDTLLQLNDYINGEEPQALQPHENLIRHVDLVKTYSNCKTDKVILAYTNARVEELNSQIQGYTSPKEGDKLFTPTLRKTFTLVTATTETPYIIKINGDLLELDSKYRTLETLHSIDEVLFYTVSAGNEEDEYCFAAVFGHGEYLKVQQRLAGEAVSLNKKIQDTYNCNPSEWAKANWSTDLARRRAKAWTKYLAFKDCVICLDFNHAMTVHKSQGSTFETVFVDIEDLSKCAKMDYQMYLKLVYVALSRASHLVYTN